ncbi:hypothetical protein Fmac_004035 [Flemingia macrophylla]|uniref:BHLH domain-containing protein n=1 Tax=Flemingia macrophylla TaxID=520843 RepID=A0ABD1N3S3_9FABA
MVPDNMKEQLALSVRSIHWSYAIFWTDSATQPGMLSWGEGYYNGDIKTRKTSQGIELNSDQIGLQRSEQLRELFKSLKTAEISPQTKRPSAALSPEDLTDAEWLPGRTLAKGQPIWLNNAHSADCRVFSRSLLAKSASIETIVCFPFMEGVIELGTTEQVSEDLSIIQQIETSFLNSLHVNVPNKPGATLKSRNREDLSYRAFDHDAYNVELTPEVGYNIANTTSPNGSSNALQATQQLDETFMVERITSGTFQVQSWQVMDDELSNCVHNSMNSSDCISQTLASPEKIDSIPKCNNPSDPCGQDSEKRNNPKMTLVDPRSDDWHYQRVLSTLLKSSDQLLMGLHLQKLHQESSFVSWKKGGSMDCQRPRAGTSQKLLKKVLFEVPQMHLDGLHESQEENDYKEGMRVEADEIGMNHVMSERRRRAKLNERFLTLRSMVPSITKDDKVSILDDVIEYLKKLERRIKVLEDQRGVTDLETETRRLPEDMVERTSDHYFSKNSNVRKPVTKKRKVSGVDDTGREIISDALKGSYVDDVTVSTSENEIVIEMKCPSRPGKLQQIMGAVNSFNIDFNSVQSTEADGNLHLTIKSVDLVGVVQRSPTVFCLGNLLWSLLCIGLLRVLWLVIS